VTSDHPPQGHAAPARRRHTRPHACRGRTKGRRPAARMRALAAWRPDDPAPRPLARAAPPSHSPPFVAA